MNSNRKFRQQVVGDKRRFLIDKLNEDEAEEELRDYD